MFLCVTDTLRVTLYGILDPQIRASPSDRGGSSRLVHMHVANQMVRATGVEIKYQEELDHQGLPMSIGRNPVL